MHIKFILILLYLTSSLTTAGSTAYLPLKQSPQIERKVDQLLLLANMPSLKKPLAINQVKIALNKVCSIQQSVLCTDIKQYLKRYDTSVSVVNAKLAIQRSNQAGASLANQRGIDYEAGYYAYVSGYSQLNDYMSISAGAQLNEQHLTSDNTYFSIGTDWLQFDLGTKPHWLSPMENSAMLLSTHAQTIPTLSISNSKPLTSIGISYEMFVGELSTSDNIYYQGEYISGNPIITGLHFSISPWKGFNLGINRLLQSGGGERGNNSLSDFFGALFDPTTNDNTDADLTVDEQFGNQAASIVSQFTFSGKTPFSLYFEYAGEDTSRDFNYKLGNSALSAGLYIPTITENIGLRLEIAEWQNAWYVHHVYKDGLTNQGNIIGHWAAESRNRDSTFSGDGVGAYNVMAKLYWFQPKGDDITITASMTKNESYTQYDYHTSYQLKVDWIKPVDIYLWESSFEYGKDVFNEPYFLISTSIAW